ncbi:DUF883 family protein [Devosia sp. PTR5]|uniref:DUF883 family protein n=1 Tax=Devosia oryzisoli TaxID=2774138 RepID=A0A927FXY3_9HYPH|nr:DUF883 family protein [Devosia oryzisoli]MBD8066684.1 DUF883 family protein [Devosia oryzisoli]
MANTPDMAPGRRKAAAAVSSVETETRERELEAQVAQLQSDLKAITETLRKLTEEKAGEVRTRAEIELEHLKRRGQHMLEDAQGQAGEYEQQLKDSIREKPLTAVAAALGVGFVLALLTRH